MSGFPSGPPATGAATSPAPGRSATTSFNSPYVFAAYVRCSRSSYSERSSRPSASAARSRSAICCRSASDARMSSRPMRQGCQPATMATTRRGAPYHAPVLTSARSLRAALAVLGVALLGACELSPQSKSTSGDLTFTYTGARLQEREPDQGEPEQELLIENSGSGAVAPVLRFTALDVHAEPLRNIT